MKIKTNRGLHITITPYTDGKGGKKIPVAPGEHDYKDIDPRDPFVRQQLDALVECGIITLEFDLASLDEPKPKPAKAKPAIKKPAKIKTTTVKLDDGD